MICRSVDRNTFSGVASEREYLSPLTANTPRILPSSFKLDSVMVVIFRVLDDKKGVITLLFCNVLSLLFEMKVLETLKAGKAG